MVTPFPFPSGLSSCVSCLLCHVLVDLLEVHIHPSCITVQKGILSGFNAGFKVECIADETLMPVRALLLQFQLSYSDKQRYEMEERLDAQKQILVDIAKKLPIYTRAQSGGTVSLHSLFL